MNPEIPVVMVVARDGSRSMFAAAENSCLREEISRTIPFPEFARNHHLEGVVNVSISTDCDGQVTVSDSTGSHPGLLGYVTDRLNSMVLGAEESKSRHFKLMLKFIMY
jgi:hypothetical protein